MDSSEKYVDVTNLEEYENLPLEKKTTAKWFWPDYWYVAPFALPIRSNTLELKSKTGTWDDFYKLIRNEYPIQYWVRETFLGNLESFLRVKWRVVEDFYRKWVYCTFKPRNSRVSAAIPKREYKEYDQIITDVLFAVAVSYVEDDECFENIDFSSNVSDRAFAKKLREIYKYIKTGRPEMLKKLDVILDEVSKKHGRLSYKKRYGKYDAFDKKIKDKDTRYCLWIVENREKIWS